MRFISDLIWFLFWSLPLRALGFFFQQMQFIYWSAQIEFNAGTVLALKSKQSKIQTINKEIEND